MAWVIFARGAHDGCGLVYIRGMKTTVALCALMLAAPVASAQWYVGGSAGLSKMHGLGPGRIDDGSFTDSGGNPTPSSTNDIAVAIGLFGGIKLDERLALEAGYTLLGGHSTQAQSNGCCVWNAGTVRGEAETSGLDISAVGRLPIDADWVFSGRFGVMRWESDFSAQGVSDSASGTDLLLGAGVERPIGRFVARAMFTRYALDDSVDALTVSLVMPLD